MKRLTLLLLFSLLTPHVFAQWEKRIGVNLLPISIGSYEVSSEFNRNPHLSLVLNGGYVHKTRHLPLIDYKVGDGVDNRRTSGVFYKVGVRYYVLRPTEVPRKANLFMSALIIGSHYSRTADLIDYSNLVDPTYTKTSQKGFSWGPAMAIGLTFRLSGRFSLDAGVQYSYLMKDDHWLGKKNRNYEPGFGERTPIGIPGKIRTSKFFPTNDQVIVVLKCKL